MDEFQRVFSSEDIKNEDDMFDTESFDQYINMETTLDRDGEEHYKIARVTKRLKDIHGNPIGKANDHVMLDNRVYEFEYADGYKEALVANLIAHNMFAQVDEEGQRHVLFDEILDMRTDGNQVLKRDEFITLKSGAKRRFQTTKGWEVPIQWKYGSTTWVTLKISKNYIRFN